MTLEKQKSLKIFDEDFRSVCLTRQARGFNSEGTHSYHYDKRLEISPLAKQNDILN